MMTFPRRAALVPLALAAAGLFAPLRVAAAADNAELKPDASKTGAGPRGTAVGPSTNPAEPIPPAGSRTGAGPRGTAVAPSTNPAEPKNPENPAQPKNK